MFLLGFIFFLKLVGSLLFGFIFLFIATVIDKNKFIQNMVITAIFIVINYCFIWVIPKITPIDINSFLFLGFFLFLNGSIVFLGKEYLYKRRSNHYDDEFLIFYYTILLVISTLVLIGAIIIYFIPDNNYVNIMQLKRIYF